MFFPLKMNELHSWQLRRWHRAIKQTILFHRRMNFPYNWYVLVPKQNERKNCQDRFYFGSRNKSVYRLQIKKTTKTKSLETEAKAILIMLIKIHQKKTNRLSWHGNKRICNYTKARWFLARLSTAAMSIFLSSTWFTDNKSILVFDSKVIVTSLRKSFMRHALQTLRARK